VTDASVEHIASFSHPVVDSASCSETSACKCQNIRRRIRK